MNDARLSARSECYGTALRKASRRVTALYDETLAPSGLRSTQFAILAEIVDRDEGPPTLNQLADDLVLDRSGLGHSLRPLEREGLIRLEKSSPTGAAPWWHSQIKAGNDTHTPSRSGRRLKTGTPPLSVKPKPTSFDNAYSRSDTTTN